MRVGQRSAGSWKVDLCACVAALLLDVCVSYTVIFGGQKEKRLLKLKLNSSLHFSVEQKITCVYIN